MSIGTESSAAAPSLSQAELDEAALREAMSLNESVRRLGLMSGIKSNARNLKTEDAAYARSLQIGDAIYDGADVTKPSDEMDVMAARDVIVNHYPAMPVGANPVQPSTPPVTSPPTSTLADKLKKAALIAAIAGGGSAVPLIYQYFTQKPAVAPVDPTLPEFSLLPPDPAPGDTK